MTFLIDTEIECPYCGETFTISVDTSQGDHTMIEDCTVCCRPMNIEIECNPGEVFAANTTRP
jgi:hypothetical protein